jgi:hypothetical protein
MNNTSTTLIRAVNLPQHFLKFSSTRISNSRGTHDRGEFQIHSSVQLFNVFFQKFLDGSTIGNYHGTEETRLQLVKQKADKLAFICSMYNVGGQSLTCDDGVKLEDGSFLYNGSYDCWSD